METVMEYPDVGLEEDDDPAERTDHDNDDAMETVMEYPDVGLEEDDVPAERTDHDDDGDDDWSEVEPPSFPLLGEVDEIPEPPE